MKNKEDKKDALCFAFYNKEIGLKSFRAQMRDLGYTDDEIDLYTDGDTELDEEQLDDQTS